MKIYVTQNKTQDSLNGYLIGDSNKKVIKYKIFGITNTHSQGVDFIKDRHEGHQTNFLLTLDKGEKAK